MASVRREALNESLWKGVDGWDDLQWYEGPPAEAVRLQP